MHVPGRTGSRLAWLAPQGCYPCAGDDAWVAVSVGDDEQWQATAGLLGPPAQDRRFATLAGRVEHHDELDELLAAWTQDPPARGRRGGAPGGRRRGVRGVRQRQARRRRSRRRPASGSSSLPSSRFPDGDLFSGHPIRLGAEPGGWWRAGAVDGRGHPPGAHRARRHVGGRRRRPHHRRRGVHRGRAGHHAAPAVRRRRRSPSASRPRTGRGARRERRTVVRHPGRRADRPDRRLCDTGLGRARRRGHRRRARGGARLAPPAAVRARCRRAGGVAVVGLLRAGQAVRRRPARQPRARGAAGAARTS